jgi:hypothetical protein
MVKPSNSWSARAAPITEAVEVRQPFNAATTAGDSGDSTELRRSALLTFPKPKPPMVVTLTGLIAVTLTAHPQPPQSRTVLERAPPDDRQIRRNLHRREFRAAADGQFPTVIA